MSPIETTLSNLTANHVHLTNIDASNNLQTQTQTCNCTGRHSCSNEGSLRLSQIDRTKKAEDRADTKLPRFPFGVGDAMLYVEIKLEQILGQMELLQVLHCDPSVYSKLEDDYEKLVKTHQGLLESGPSGWKRNFDIRYISDVSSLKGSVRKLHNRCQTASQTIRKLNVKMKNLRRVQRQIKESPSRAGPEWIPVLQAIRDSDDEGANDEVDREDDAGQDDRGANQVNVASRDNP